MSKITRGLFLLLSVCLGMRAQEVTATLSGTVTDSSGSAVPGATIKIHNDQTGYEPESVRTDGQGNYTVTNLQPGDYTVSVSDPGFQSFKAANVVLHVGDHRTLSGQLQPGQVTESVTVEESTTLVQTSSAAESGTITGTQMRELELNNRNFEQLVTLQPGVSSGLPDEVGFGLENTTSVVVNGTRYTANNWTVDGADINDSGSNQTLLNVPSVDAIQEFTLQRSAYDAEYGRSGGAQVVVATKSGTREFHGDLYEFVRNDIFDANSFLNNASGTPKPPFRYNDFGFTIGGPIFLPKFYPKKDSTTFFFWSQEWRKNQSPTPFDATLPSASDLAGVFTPDVLPNPSAAPPGCLNTNSDGSYSIVPTCISKNAQGYINNVYSKFSPNYNGNQYISTVQASNNYRQDLARLDQNIGSRVHLYARYIHDVVPTTEPSGLFASEPLPGISSTQTSTPGKNIVTNATWTISPRVVNEIAYNYSWGAINSTVTGLVQSPAFNQSLTGSWPYQSPYGIVPSVTFGNGYAGVVAPNSPYFERNIDKNLYDNLSWVVGNHSLRTGFTVQWMYKTENLGGGAGDPNFTFDDTAFTGNSWANFLLGDATVYSQGSRDIIPQFHYANVEAYVQDDWKVSPRVTLNLGLRYSFFPSVKDNSRTLNNFDPRLFNAAAAPAIDPGNGNFVDGQGITPATYSNGIIYAQGKACSQAQTVSSQVTCSPFGAYVNPNPKRNFGPRFGFAWDVFGNGKTAIRGGYGVFFDRSYSTIWEENGWHNPPLLQSAEGTNVSFDNPVAGTPLGPIVLHASGNPNLAIPYYQDWNVTIQQRVADNTVLEVGYVATKGTHLLGEYDVNQVPESVRLANPNVSANALRPYQGYAGISTVASNFDSNYNSLQVSLNRQVTHGLSLGAAFTWSRNLTDASQASLIDTQSSSVYDTYNYRNNYGPAPFNTPLIFILNYVYQLPVFKAQSGFVGHVLGGWEVSGITSFESGQSQTITQSTDPFDNYPGGIGIDLIGGFSPRADVVPGVRVNGPKTAAEFFNPAAFMDAVGHFGTAAPGVILGPGLQNWDIALLKNIKIGERFSAQFRAESFNTFNHVNFSSVDTNVDDSNFGQVTGTHDPRIMQFGLKLYF